MSTKAHRISQMRCFALIGIVLIALVRPELSPAQTTGAIEGKVFDKTTGLPMGDVNIEVVGTRLGDVTDATGFYQLPNLRAGTYRLRASRIGYEPLVKSIELKPNEIVRQAFHLPLVLIQLSGVEIEAERLWEKYLTEASLVGVQRMRARQVSNIPGALDDPTRAVQIFSGVSGGGDYSGFVAIRGGSPDQNQVIIDGVEVPNPYRFRLAFGGGLSTINPNTTEDIYLHLGGFSAEYGNSLTSILEVETRTGNRERVRTQGTINFTDVSAIVEGPLPALNGSFLLSLRRTYYDLIVNQISKSNSVFPFFYDFTGKWSFELNKTNRVTLNFTRMREGTELLNEFSEDLNLEEAVNSNIASISWRRLQGERWQFNTLLSLYTDDMSYRAFASDTASKIQEFESIDAQVTHIAFKENVRYKTGPESWFNWGLSVTSVPSRIDFDSADLSFLYARIESPRDIRFDRNTTTYASYLEANTKASERLHLRIGVRYDYSTLVHEGEISPRFNLWYQLDDKTTVNASWGVFYQYPNPLSIYTRNIPVDLSTNLEVISAEKATHFILGIERMLDDDFTARLNVYNKDIDRLLLPENEFTFAPENSGRGLARGFEFMLEKKPAPQRRISGILSYAYGNARYRTLQSKVWLPFKYDRRHALTALLNVKLFGNWAVSLLGQFATGLPFTDVLGVRTTLNADGTTRWDFVRGDRFQARFPDFKKVDARLSYQSRVGPNRLSFYLDIINLTNEQNLYEITWEKKFLPDETQRGTRRMIYMLPLIPSFGVSFRF
ncbi:MAG: TonB-dependent receptor domain-containing protein [bacterium]